VAVVAAVLPLFNDLTGKQLILNPYDLKLWSGIGIIIFITGLLSGSYPAWLLSSFKISKSLKGVIKHSLASVLFRNALVVFQFSLSILLIIGTLVVSQQMDYILSKNLGLDKENLIFINMKGDLAKQVDVYKTELLKIPEVDMVTFASGNPLSYGRSTGGASWEGKDPNQEVEINVLMVDIDFIQTMKMEINQGRNF